MIFETENTLVRKLLFTDLAAFHELESNPNVLQYADGEVKSYFENKQELQNLIDNYSKVDNTLWIYAVERKIDCKFLGTIALIMNENTTEIGCRFLEKYWNKGYGSEVCKAFFAYCKQMKIETIIAYASKENRATIKILEKNNFKLVADYTNKLELEEVKFQLDLTV